MRFRFSPRGGFTLLVTLFSATAFAQDYGDGLYALSESETARSIPGQDGARRWVGERVDLDIEQSSVFAMDNFNETFEVRIRYRDASASRPSEPLVSPPSEIPSFALIAGSDTQVTSFWGGSRGNPTIGFQIVGQENAERAAELFGTTVLRRDHPGHRLSVRFLPQEQTIRPAEPVKVELEVTNVGDVAVQFYCCPPSQFSFGAMRQGVSVQDIGHSQVANTLVARKSIEPGQSQLLSVDLNSWFAFDQPGEYFIWGFYRYALLAPDVFGDLRPIWTDYLPGEFNVTVAQ